jgi:transcription initiation factor TFIIB
MTKDWLENLNVAHEGREKLQSFSKDLDAVARKLGVDEAVVAKASLIYQQAIDRGLGNRGSASAMVAASLYAACRIASTQRNLRDIEAASRIRKKEIARFYRLLFQELDLSVPPADPSAFVSTIASRARVSERSQRRAYDLLRRCNEAHGTGGKEPVGLAAAALYMGCVMENEKKSQKRVANAADVSEVTIRNRCKELKTLLNI